MQAIHATAFCLTVTILVWIVQRCQNHNREIAKVRDERELLIARILPPKFCIRIFRIVPKLAKTKIK
jgi:hypothetical protein